MAIPGSIKIKTGSEDAPEGQTPQTALFISKVWKIVNQPSTDMLISWSETGKTFIVHQEATFAKQVLPHYFKHSNFTSFVRQLNLYGFRKVAKPDQGGLTSIQDDSVEFWHTNFRRGHPELLPLVQRRPVIKQEEKNPNVSRVMSDIHQMKEKQEGIASLLEELKEENFHLKREVMVLKEKHDIQHKVLNKIIHFVIQMLYKGRMPIFKNHLMLTDAEDVGHLPSPKRPKISLDPISVCPNSPTLLYDPNSPGFPTIEDISPSLPDPPPTLVSDLQAPQNDLQLPGIPDTSVPLDPSSSLMSGDEFLTDLFQPTSTDISSQQPLTTQDSPLKTQSQTPSCQPEIQAQSQSLSSLDSLSSQSQPHSQPQPGTDLSQSQSQNVDIVPYNNKMVTQVASHLNTHQAELDSLPDTLLDQLNLDPSLLSGLLTMEYVPQIPEYDTVDTARLLESLMDPEKDVCHESKLHVSPTIMGQYPALPPGETDSTLEELLAVVSTASSSSSTPSVSTSSAARVKI